MGKGAGGWELQWPPHLPGQSRDKRKRSLHTYTKLKRLHNTEGLGVAEASSIHSQYSWTVFITFGSQRQSSLLGG